LHDILTDKPAVIVLLRHFGWLFCKEQAVQLNSINQEIVDRNLQLIFVGSGTYHQAKYFQDDYKISAPVFSDANLVLYQALGAKKSIISSMSPQVIVAGIRAFFKGYVQTKIQGDYLQQGGAALVMQNGDIPFIKLSKFAGDHIRPEELLLAIKKY